MFISWLVHQLIFEIRGIYVPLPVVVDPGSPFLVSLQNVKIFHPSILVAIFESQKAQRTRIT